MPEAKASTRKPKTLYNPNFPDQAHKLCLLGATDKDLASFFGICKSTLANWKKQHTDFNQAVLRGKKAADMEVAASLYQATLDRIITTKQAIKCKEVYYDENGKRVEKERVEIVEVEKHIPADFRSQQFWLKNRNPQQWSDKYDDDDTDSAKSITLNLGSGLNPHETAD
ncbi:hypothetical protein [Flavobacterium beibuense]|uniref:Terminase n=1 Tax=Flavobacterium beibuense TaxID=657326 RepID=A0A444WFC8_9FLAO|nr:hypothetical protein [Flavobacterium beibuense]RYJ44553.1 hypothetical protein NU09_1163 [Flavobacterium beibuense]